MLEPLRIPLAAKGVQRLEVFPYSRPGEPSFWTAFLFVEGRRHCVGTPDLLNRPLADQLLDLVQQLDAFEPSLDGLADWEE